MFYMLNVVFQIVYVPWMYFDTLVLLLFYKSKYTVMFGYKKILCTLFLEERALQVGIRAKV